MSRVESSVQETGVSPKARERDPRNDVGRKGVVPDGGGGGFRFFECHRFGVRVHRPFRAVYPHAKTMADIERRMKQLRARKQRIVARENAKARKRRTHLIIRLGGILSNEGVLGYDEGVWNDEGNRQRLLDMLKAHAAELRAWASDAGVRLPSAESAGELREQVRDLPQEPQIQEQPGYGYQPGFQQPQQWQQQPWN